MEQIRQIVFMIIHKNMIVCYYTFKSFYIRNRMEQECLFQAEYAKSNRSTCKSCKLTIGKDSLRLAVMVQVSMYVNKIDLRYCVMLLYMYNVMSLYA